MSKSIDIGSPTRTQAILNEYGLRAKKKLGQNFLTDGNVLAHIVDTAAVTDSDLVVEIGPGIGALTEHLARQARDVLAVEVDPQMIEVLDETMLPYQNVHVVEADVLKTNLADLAQTAFGQAGPLKIVANLPYYITTPILMHLLAAGLDWTNMVVMMQKEVAERLSAPVGSKEYGVLTLMLAYYARAELAFIVPARSFSPAPRVDSAVVKLVPIRDGETVENPSALFDLIKACFAHRRKSLWNNLLQRYGKAPDTKERLTAALSQAEIDPGIRAERLTLADFIRLYRAVQA
ncbi:16S rRNA (adenine(1518)-N(6)/adenine(1519)-N(6))-dimethyltransferase RsmA [Lactobacillaceae bacterium L1_55_11]|nr:16S rRNA (adenine(1518)-N(6)/adenine(1519)-N(6))-dimethyltransferase RsmA [Lactobacillaceae bacterium L1_55_11]